MARPKRIVGDIDTVEKILSAARLEFSERGFMAARLEDIGKRCQISRASILYHFESKHTLLDTVFERAISTARARVLHAAQANEANYVCTIRSVTLALSDIEKEEPGTAAVVLHALLTKPAIEKLKVLFQDLLTLITQLFIQSGAEKYHSVDMIRAAIAHILMGELCRLALGTQAQEYWGESDPLMPIINQFFQLPTIQKI